MDLGKTFQTERTAKQRQRMGHSGKTFRKQLVEMNGR